MKRAALMAILIGVEILSAQTKPDPKLDEKEPSAEWLQKYEDYLALQRVVEKHRREDPTEVEYAKLGNELAKEIPSGYQFTPATRKFIKLPPEQSKEGSKP